MKRKSADRRGFTLVELLVAIVVLSLLVLIIAQVVTLTGDAINLDSKDLAAAEQGREVLDRIGLDLAARPNRSDLGMIFTKTASPGVSDCFRFYSQVGSYADSGSGIPRALTGVGYWVPTATTGTGRPAYQLERGITETDFNEPAASVQFLPAKLTAADTTASDNPINDYEVLARGVFRLEFCYLLTDGKWTITNPNAAATDFTGIAAIVVALGVLDSKSLQLLTSPDSQLANLSAALPKVTDGGDPISEWTAAMASPSFGAGAVPAAVRRNVHVYERTFYVQ